ncbi:hypothetical protein [Rubidibacter lacunae]|nr:hypothetical protein [Rubidibacter lacunae]
MTSPPQLQESPVRICSRGTANRRTVCIAKTIARWGLTRSRVHPSPLS